MTRNIVILPAENLFAVIARIQPSIWGHGLASEERSLTHRLAQVHRIVNHGENCDRVAVSNEMFGDCSGIALRYAIRTDPAALDVCGGDRQYVAFEFSRRKTCERMRCIWRRVRTSIHINRSVYLSNLAPVPDRKESLRVRISLFPEPVISRRHPSVGRNIAHTLLLLDSLPGRGPGQGIKTSGVI